MEGKAAMKMNTCEACGYKGRTGDIVARRIIPEEVTEEAEVPDSGTVALCVNCRNELHTWYSKKVSDLTYDPSTKRFIPRTAAEMAQEFEATYRAFAEYKKRQRKKH